MEIKIEHASSQDMDALALVEVLSKTDSFQKNQLEPFELDLDARKQKWEFYFKGLTPQTALPPRVVYKALVDGNIVGFIAGHLTTRFGLDAELQSMYVLYPYQKKGIGSVMFYTFIDWVSSHNAKTLCVGFHEHNPYRSFYIKHGGSYLNPHWITWNSLPKNKI